MMKNVINKVYKCLALCGALDPVTTVADGEVLKQQIPDCLLAVVEASHLSNIEQPQAFNQALLSFIQS